MKRKISFSDFLPFLFSPAQRRRFEGKVSKLENMCFDPRDPLGDLRRSTQSIIKDNGLVFFLNSKSYLVGDKTIAPFEKTCKSLRKAYRMRLSGILKDVKANKEGLCDEELMAILCGLDAEYRSLAGKKNIFRRGPCKEGIVKIRAKLEDIEKTIELLRSSFLNEIYIAAWLCPLAWTVLSGWIR